MLNLARRREEGRGGQGRRVDFLSLLPVLDVVCGQHHAMNIMVIEVESGEVQAALQFDQLEIAIDLAIALTLETGRNFYLSHDDAGGDELQNYPMQPPR
jgi:hypothetical protein